MNARHLFLLVEELEDLPLPGLPCWMLEQIVSCVLCVWVGRCMCLRACVCAVEPGRRPVVVQHEVFALHELLNQDKSQGLRKCDLVMNMEIVCCKQQRKSASNFRMSWYSNE